MIERHLAGILAAEAGRMPIVTVLGPRQSGKTTLVRAAFPDHAYVSLERPDRRAEAREDPLGFLEERRGGLIIDEVQRAPELLSYLQVAVDEDDRPGRYILTGSQNLLLMANVSQTLAGRTALLTLLPFSWAELRGVPAWAPGEPPPGGRPEAPDVSVWEAAWKGLYPRIHDRDLDPTRWLGDYVRTYVERDVREVLRVGDLDAFERFVRLLAARTASELNLTALAEDVGVSQPTAKSWLTALRVGALVDVVPPHRDNFGKRLRKRPKLHFVDTGLVCYLLGIRSPDELRSHPLRGAIFETFVAAELRKAFVHRGQEAPLFHWRDATGHEIDLVIERGTRLTPVEVKSAHTVTSRALDGLRWWMDLAGDRCDGGYLVLGGGERHRHGAVTALPWFLG